MSETPRESEYDRLKAQKDAIVQREEERVIGKWKLKRAGGYDPENPQPDPTLPDSSPPPAPSPATTSAWPDAFTMDEKELLQLGIVHAIVFHEEQRKMFAKDAGDPRFNRHRAGCLRVATHHQEEIYKLGELAAKIGMRNGWPRP